MNVVIYNPDSGRSHVRPDTSVEKENRDLYAPEDVDGWWYSPVLFAGICRAGKCVGEKFAERYLGSFGFGALLYAGEDAPENLPYSSCHDHTTILPFPLVEKEKFGGRMSVSLDGEELYSACMDTEKCRKLIVKALCRSTAHISVRIGDIVAVELQQMSHLVKVEEDSIHCFSGTRGDEEVFGFKLIR